MGTVSAFGSKCNPGRSTYGGDTRSGTVRAFGSGDGPGQWTHGGDITFRTLEHSVLNTDLIGRPMEGNPVLEPLEHSVLEMTLDGRSLVEMSVLEPLEHSVPDVAPVWGDCSLIKMTGLDPLEHSGLGVTDNVDLDSRPVEVMSNLEPLEHSVLIAALGGRPMEGTPVLESLEHSILEVALLDGGLVDEMSQLEPLEHSVLHTALDGRPREGIPVLEPLEHSVLDMALDGGLTKGDGGPKLGPDSKLTLSELPHATMNDDLMLGAPVPLPADNVGCVALSPADGRLRAGDVNTDGNITTGLHCWNTEGDVLAQYETFNGMPVYYGSDMYESEDSDWDDLYALTSAAYVEDYKY